MGGGVGTSSRSRLGAGGGVGKSLQPVRLRHRGAGVVAGIAVVVVIVVASSAAAVVFLSLVEFVPLLEVVVSCKRSKEAEELPVPLMAWDSLLAITVALEMFGTGVQGLASMDRAIKHADRIAIAATWERSRAEDTRLLCCRLVGRRWRVPTRPDGPAAAAGAAVAGASKDLPSPPLPPPQLLSGEGGIHSLLLQLSFASSSSFSSSSPPDPLLQRDRAWLPNSEQPSVASVDADAADISIESKNLVDSMPPPRRRDCTPGEVHGSTNRPCDCLPTFSPFDTSEFFPFSDLGDGPCHWRGSLPPHRKALSHTMRRSTWRAGFIIFLTGTCLRLFATATFPLVSALRDH
jgi:hypothetical protein